MRIALVVSLCFMAATLAAQSFDLPPVSLMGGDTIDWAKGDFFTDSTEAEKMYYHKNIHLRRTVQVSITVLSSTETEAQLVSWSDTTRFDRDVVPTQNVNTVALYEFTRDVSIIRAKQRSVHEIPDLGAPPDISPAPVVQDLTVTAVGLNHAIYSFTVTATGVDTVIIAYDTVQIVYPGNPDDLGEAPPLVPTSVIQRGSTTIPSGTKTLTITTPTPFDSNSTDINVWVTATSGLIGHEFYTIQPLTGNSFKLDFGSNIPSIYSLTWEMNDDDNQTVRWRYASPSISVSSFKVYAHSTLDTNNSWVEGYFRSATTAGNASGVSFWTVEFTDGGDSVQFTATGSGGTTRHHVAKIISNTEVTVTTFALDFTEASDLIKTATVASHDTNAAVYLYSVRSFGSNQFGGRASFRLRPTALTTIEARRWIGSTSDVFIKGFCLVGPWATRRVYFGLGAGETGYSFEPSVDVDYSTIRYTGGTKSDASGDTLSVVTLRPLMTSFGAGTATRGANEDSSYFALQIIEWTVPSGDEDGSEVTFSSARWREKIALNTPGIGSVASIATSNLASSQQHWAQIRLQRTNGTVSDVSNIVDFTTLTTPPDTGETLLHDVYPIGLQRKKETDPATTLKSDTRNGFNNNGTVSLEALKGGTASTILVIQAGLVDDVDSVGLTLTTLTHDSSGYVIQNDSTNYYSFKGREIDLYYLKSMNITRISQMDTAGTSIGLWGDYTQRPYYPPRYHPTRSVTPPHKTGRTQSTFDNGFYGAFPEIRIPLTHEGAFDVPANENRQVLVVVRVPTDADAGTYNGNIYITESGARTRTIPVTLRVSSLTLDGSKVMKNVFIFDPEEDPLTLMNNHNRHSANWWKNWYRMAQDFHRDYAFLNYGKIALSSAYQTSGSTYAPNDSSSFNKMLSRVYTGRLYESSSNYHPSLAMTGRGNPIHLIAPYEFPGGSVGDPDPRTLLGGKVKFAGRKATSGATSITQTQLDNISAGFGKVETDSSFDSWFRSYHYFIDEPETGAEAAWNLQTELYGWADNNTGYGDSVGSVVAMKLFTNTSKAGTSLGMYSIEKFIWFVPGTFTITGQGYHASRAVARKAAGQLTGTYNQHTTFGTGIGIIDAHLASMRNAATIFVRDSLDAFLYWQISRPAGRFRTSRTDMWTNGAYPQMNGDGHQVWAGSDTTFNGVHNYGFDGMFLSIRMSAWARAMEDFIIQKMAMAEGLTSNLTAMRSRLRATGFETMEAVEAVLEPPSRTTIKSYPTYPEYDFVWENEMRQLIRDIEAAQ